MSDLRFTCLLNKLFARNVLKGEQGWFDRAMVDAGVNLYKHCVPIKFLNYPGQGDQNLIYQSRFLTSIFR